MDNLRLLAKQFAVSVAAVGVVVLWASVSSAYSTWTPPTATAPGNNADLPLNTSGTGQIKNGGLTLNAAGSASSIGLVVYNGKVGIDTASPAGTLDINGSLCIAGDCITSWSSFLSNVSIATMIFSPSTSNGNTLPSGTECYSGSATNTKVSCADAFFPDDATAKKVCDLVGYGGFTGLSEQGFNSPSNNNVLVWNGTKWLRYAASDSGRNRTITSITCIKLTQSGS
jgi:hypothetical protein